VLFFRMEPPHVGCYGSPAILNPPCHFGRAASGSPAQAILCRNAGFSRQILTIPGPPPHECGAPGGLDAALSFWPAGR
jgi:hypothetical protein